MRHIIPLFTLLFIYSLCKSQGTQPKEKIKNDLTVENLKGKIKTMTETHYEMVEKFGELKKGQIQDKVVYVYNPSGMETGVTDYGSPGNIVNSKVSKQFDSHGNKIEQSDYDYTGTVKTNYKYDSKGNLIEEAIANFNKYTYTYDAQNKLLEKSLLKKYIKGFQLESKDILKYDEKGNRVEWAAYNGDGSLHSMTQYKYDDNNNIIEQFYKSPDGKSDSRVVTKYDINNNKIECSSYDLRGRLSDHSTTKYNQNNTISESNRSYSYESDPNVKYIEIYRYDNNGNEIEYSFGTSSTTYKYEFDKAVNWVKKTGYQNNRTTSLIERTIEYY